MKLKDLYLALDQQERDVLARRADIVPGYLWQIAMRWRGKRPSIDVIQRLVSADKRLTLKELLEEFSEAPRERRAAEKSRQEPSHA